MASSGNVIDEIIKAHIQKQDLQEKNTSDNFDTGWKWREEDNLTGHILGCFNSTSNLPALTDGGLVDIIIIKITKFFRSMYLAILKVAIS